MTTAPTTDSTDVRTPPRLSTAQLTAAMLALATGGFTIGTTEFVTMGLLPEVAEGVGVSIPTAGHIISAYALGVVVGAPVIAFLGARAPRRALLIGDRYVLQPDLASWGYTAPKGGEAVPEGFHYTSDNNDRWFSGEEMVSILETEV